MQDESVRLKNKRQLIISFEINRLFVFKMIYTLVMRKKLET